LYDQLLHFLDVVREHTPEVRVLQRFREVEQGAKEFQKRVKRPKLANALGDTIYNLSTDPRDKIYGIMGLCRDGAELVPTPNYTQAPEKVYFDAIKGMVAADEKLKITCNMQTSHAPPNRCTPSPDWTDLARGLPGLLITALCTYPPEDPRDHELRPYRATEKINALPNIGSEIDDGSLENLATLTASGLHAIVDVEDTIQSVASYGTTDGCSSMEDEKTREHLQPQAQKDDSEAWKSFKAFLRGYMPRRARKMVKDFDKIPHILIDMCLQSK
jgi:hypothetical protein